jgi:hypothetical protein
MGQKKVFTLGLCVMMVISLFTTSFVLIQNPINNESSTGQVVANKDPKKEPLDRGTRSSAGWMNETRLTYSPGNSTTPEVAGWGSNVYVVWSDDRNGNYEIYFKKSPDNGLSWTNDTRLTVTSFDNYDPHIAVDQNFIHVVWYGNISCYYINSTDYGNTWGTITMWDWTSYPACFPDDPLFSPDVTVSGNNVYIVAYAFGVEDIIFKRSTDNGNSWSLGYWFLILPGFGRLQQLKQMEV